MGRGSGNPRVPAPSFCQNSARREVIEMDFGKGIIFILTRDDVIGCAKEMGIPEGLIDDQFLKEIKDGVT